VGFDLRGQGLECVGPLHSVPGQRAEILDRLAQPPQQRGADRLQHLHPRHQMQQVLTQQLVHRLLAHRGPALAGWIEPGQRHQGAESLRRVVALIDALPQPTLQRRRLPLRQLLAHQQHLGGIVGLQHPL
jgi:hypothetical protein